ncbi:DUF1214 domain-containing protein [Nocardia sp. NPDC057272]|uniref:DUF1214 domain-containing protein n=1 Tax=Nocardia sp. NPDC057272 TaxID=3346079 RepID=UPI0036385329
MCADRASGGCWCRAVRRRSRDVDARTRSAHAGSERPRLDRTGLSVRIPPGLQPRFDRANAPRGHRRYSRDTVQRLLPCPHPRRRHGDLRLGQQRHGVLDRPDRPLTITISHAEPTDPKARANWLPAPEGDFRPCMRMYEPQPPVLDQTYLLPPITRT